MTTEGFPRATSKSEMTQLDSGSPTLLLLFWWFGLFLFLFFIGSSTRSWKRAGFVVVVSFSVGTVHQTGFVGLAVPELGCDQRDAAQSGREGGPRLLDRPRCLLQQNAADSYLLTGELRAVFCTRRRSCGKNHCAFFLEGCRAGKVSVRTRPPTPSEARRSQSPEQTVAGKQRTEWRGCWQQRSVSTCATWRGIIFLGFYFSQHSNLLIHSL